MRTLEKNKMILWITYPTGMVDVVDDDGFYTGEKVMSYSTPEKIKLLIYPSNGDIINRIFGKDVSCDMISVSNSIDLNTDSLLFYSEPSGDYSTTYDLNIIKKLKSLNTFSYGFGARV